MRLSAIGSRFCSLFTDATCPFLHDGYIGVRILHGECERISAVCRLGNDLLVMIELLDYAHCFFNTSELRQL